jgi:hypothetical protein
MKLRVKARGTAMVPDIDAMNGHRRAFIGRFLDKSQGEKYTDFEGVSRQQAVFGVVDGDVEVPSYHEYMRSVKDGDLWAADFETAEYCGVKFDPSFGEYPKDKGSE